MQQLVVQGYASRDQGNRLRRIDRNHGHPLGLAVERHDGRAASRECRFDKVGKRESAGQGMRRGTDRDIAFQRDQQHPCSAHAPAVIPQH